MKHYPLRKLSYPEPAPEPAETRRIVVMPEPELGFFGEVTDMAGQTLPKLPSSASVQAALNGEKNGWGKVVASTALRALLVMPGVALAGARGKDLVVGSMLSSATITAFIFFFYGIKGNGSGE